MITTYKVFDTNKKKIPGVVELCWYGFAGSSGEKIRGRFLAELVRLPTGTKELDISANQFGLCEIPFLMDVLQSIKQKISKLNLSFNQFNKMDHRDLITFLAKIPSVEYLDFSNNRLYDYSMNQLIELFKALPSSVQSVDMTNTLRNDPMKVQSLQDKLHELGRNLSLVFHSENEKPDVYP